MVGIVSGGLWTGEGMLTINSWGWWPWPLLLLLLRVVVVGVVSDGLQTTG